MRNQFLNRQTFGSENEVNKIHSSLWLKVMQLRSLVSVGLGGTIPQVMSKHFKIHDN